MKKYFNFICEISCIVNFHFSHNPTYNINYFYIGYSLLCKLHKKSVFIIIITTRQSPQQNKDKTRTKQGQNRDKTGTKQGQNRDKTGTKQGQNKDKTRTKQGQNRDKTRTKQSREKHK